METAPLEPQIEIEHLPGELRITVPKTARVVAYYRRSIAARSATIVVQACLFGTIATFAIVDRQLCLGSFFGSFAVFCFGGVIYSIRHPERVNLFMPSTTVIRLDENGLSVMEVERGRTRRYAREEIRAIQAQRCDFSRCGRLVVSAKRYQRRRSKAIVAVYSNLQPLTEIAAVLRREIGSV